MKDNDKAQFTRKAADNNGIVRINIPQEIANHLNLKPGETVGLQTEHSEEYGVYASFWNETRQEKQETE